MSTVRESIIDRCRKLMALANNDATGTHEAEKAVGLASRLMARHGIELADLEAGTYGEGFAEERVSLQYRRPPRWVRFLACSVATPLDCQVVTMRRGNVVVDFCGRQSDAQVAAYLFEWLHGLLPRVVQEVRPVCRHPQQWRESFILAASAAIQRRMEREKKEAMAEAQAAEAEARAAADGGAGAGPLFGNAERATAIVALKTAGMERFIQATHPDIKTSQVDVPDNMDPDGAHEGYQYGNNLPLKKAIAN